MVFFWQSIKQIDTLTVAEKSLKYTLEKNKSCEILEICMKQLMNGFLEEFVETFLKLSFEKNPGRIPEENISFFQ